MVVTVYTTGAACMACRGTKRHLDRIGVPYNESPLCDDELEAARELDLLRAPIVCASFDGCEWYWDGHRPDKLDHLARILDDE